MSEEEIVVHFFVGKCSVCKKDIDNAVEGYFTDTDGKLYCENCYSASA